MLKLMIQVAIFFKLFTVDHDMQRLTMHKKMKFPIEHLLSKCDQIRSFLRVWSHLLKKSLMENVIFCAV